jgi:hypothetical protein
MEVRIRFRRLPVTRLPLFEPLPGLHTREGGASGKV